MTTTTAYIIGTILYLIGSAMDIVSTQQAMRAGLRELNPIYQGRPSMPKMIVFTAILWTPIPGAIWVGLVDSTELFTRTSWPIAYGLVSGIVIRGGVALLNWKKIRGLKK